jgi:hypothetical protein
MSLPSHPAAADDRDPEDDAWEGAEWRLDRVSLDAIAVDVAASRRK